MTVVSETVFVTEALGRLYVPMRSLMTSTLKLSWTQVHAKRLERMKRRWHVLTLAVTAIDGSVTMQPCVRAVKVPGFLWALNPREPRAMERLVVLQDHWEHALLAHMMKTPELLDPPLAALIEVNESLHRSLRKELDEAKYDSKRKDAIIADAEEKIKVLDSKCRSLTGKESIKRRWGEIAPSSENTPYVDTPWWALLKKATEEAKSIQTVATRLGVSRTMISLTLSGKYNRSTSSLEAKVLKHLR